MAVSQVSPGSTIPLPQVVGQSKSVAAVAPAGQQPSLLETLALVSTVWVQVALQSVAELCTSAVHPTPSSQSAGGQAPGSPAAMAVSHCSPASGPLPTPASTTHGPPAQAICT